MLLSVIIVNYNVKYFLEYCLYSVEKAMKNIEGEIFVVDNLSTDNSKEFFRNKFPGVFFIWNSENEGFAKANNKALKNASGAYVLFLNPDAIVPEDCFEQCISFIKSQNNQVACGIKMIDGEGKYLKESKRAFPSPLTSLYKLAGLTKLFPKSKIFSKYHLGFLDKNVNQVVDVLAGAFMMIPKEIVDTVGGFDERFFMYAEDIDLSYRMQKAGYQNFYFAESSIIHFKGESTRKGGLNYVKMFYKAMSVFVKKHYGQTGARIFNFSIQAAIFFRASVAATARFLRWIGLPVIDAAMILLSFWLVKFVWNAFVKREVNYSPNMLVIAFPAFTILFLAASYFAGLYDNGYRQSRLNRSAVTAMLVLLATYSLLPESLRFSRGILFFGAIMAFFFMTIERWLLLHWNIIENSPGSDEMNQIIIVGTRAEFNNVSALLQSTGMQERVLGRITPEELPETKSIGSFNNLVNFLNLYPVREIIFCEGALSFKKIIEVLPHLPPHVRKKLYAANLHTLIGSAGANETANYISKFSNFRLGQPVSRRNKILADIIIAFLFLISFPLHCIIKSRRLLFFKNVLSVLFLKKTWVGYALNEKNLPTLRPGILTTTGLPAAFNTLPDESLYKTDSLYAKNFYIFNDIKMVWLNYKLLS
ncbi:MAG: glycosyltransferase [Ginsengibacter sp.]